MSVEKLRQSDTLSILGLIMGGRIYGYPLGPKGSTTPDNDLIKYGFYMGNDRTLVGCRTTYFYYELGSSGLALGVTGIDLLRSDGRGNHVRTGSVLILDRLWSKDGKNGTGDRHNTRIVQTDLENYAQLLFSNANGGSRPASVTVGWLSILDVFPLGTRGIRATGAVAALVYQQHMEPEEAIALVQGALSDLRQADVPVRYPVGMFV